MLIRHQLALKAGGVGLSLVQKLIYILLIKHPKIFHTLIDLNARLVLCIAPIALVVWQGLPVLEVVTHYPHIVVLLSSGLLSLVFKLRSLHQP